VWTTLVDTSPILLDSGSADQSKASLKSLKAFTGMLNFSDPPVIHYLVLMRATPSMK
jgi:hypothetical protein